MFMRPDELGDFTRSELKYWSDAIGQTGIKVEE